MNFLSKIFRSSEEELDKKAYESGYTDGLKSGLNIGKKEGEKRGWKEAMSAIANLADEMIVKKD